MQQTAFPSHDLIDRAFSRITGSRSIEGNHLRLLKDAAENYPAWLDAIRRAERTIHFENYIIADDPVGREFAEALAERAQAGVRVHVLYDWLGSLLYRSDRLRAGLMGAGVQVRAFNPPRLAAPLGWVHRDHRKVVVVDGETAFVSGLCVAKSWHGNPAKSLEPWRDTGVELKGPAVADVEAAFAESWAAAGPPLMPDEIDKDPPVPAGNTTVRVISSTPGQLSLYRLDQLIAAGARATLWLTDAYYIATSSYVRALTEAARDGVDVRLLVPGSSDVLAMQTVMRSGYRPLLEAGVRVFEWNGTMLHAKTAVADGAWARIGSTNLNWTSWMGNWELDITVDDTDFAGEMEAMYLADLTNSTEITLDARRRVRSIASAEGRDTPVPARRGHGEGRTKGKGTRLAATAIGLGSAAGAAIADTRPLASTEAQVIANIALLLLAAAALLYVVPQVVEVLLIIVLVASAIGLLWRSWRLRRQASAQIGETATQDDHEPEPPLTSRRQGRIRR